jgi:hypothetical protein
MYLRAGTQGLLWGPGESPSSAELLLPAPVSKWELSRSLLLGLSLGAALPSLGWGGPLA